MDPVIAALFRTFALMVAVFCFSVVAVIILSWLIPFIKIHTNKKVRLFRKFVKGKNVEWISEGLSGSFKIMDGEDDYRFDKFQKNFFKRDPLTGRHSDHVNFDGQERKDYIIKFLEKEAEKTKLRKEKNILKNLVKTSGQAD